MTQQNKQPVVLILADGFGLSASWQSNALASAKPVHFFDLWQNYQHLVLKSSPAYSREPYRAYEMIASGKITDENDDYFQLLSKDLTDNKPFLSALDSMKRNSSNLHLVVEVSKEDSRLALLQMAELLKFAKYNLLSSVFVHLLIDGSIATVEEVNFFAEKIEWIFGKVDLGQIATITGKDALEEDNSKVLENIFLNSGKRFLAVKQVLANSKNKKPSSLAPSYISTRQSLRVKNFDIFAFLTVPDHHLSSLLRQMMIVNRESSGPDSPSFLSFFVISEFPFDLQNEVKYLKHRDVSSYLTTYLSADNKNELLISDRLNLPNLNCYYVGDSSKIDESIADVAYDPILKKSGTTTRTITQRALSEISSGKYDFITVNFPSLHRSYLEHAFNDCVSEIILIDTALKKISDLVLSLGGHLLFCAPFGGAETVGTRFGDTNMGKSALPFMLISESSKHSSKLNLVEEIIHSHADLTSVNEALKIVLLEEK